MYRVLSTLLALGLAANPILADETADPAVLSDHERAELVSLLSESRERVERVIAATPAELWTVKPAADRWSVGEVVEHLILSESLIRGLGLGALATEPDPEWEAVAARTSAAQLVATLGDRTQKFQAPEPLKPSGELDRDESLRQFSGERAVTLDFARSTTAPIKRYVAAGPPGTMNVAQWLTLVGAHTMRHAAQAEEALALASEAASPAGAAPES